MARSTHSPLSSLLCSPSILRSHGTRFSTLAVLARRYLAMPASSAASERLFSRLKLTATAARDNFDPRTLCQLLFVDAHQLDK